MTTSNEIVRTYAKSRRSGLLLIMWIVCQVVLAGKGDTVETRIVRTGNREVASDVADALDQVSAETRRILLRSSVHAEMYANRVLAEAAAKKVAFEDVTNEEVNARKSGDVSIALSSNDALHQIVKSLQSIDATQFVSCVDANLGAIVVDVQRDRERVLWVIVVTTSSNVAVIPPMDTNSTKVLMYAFKSKGCREWFWDRVKHLPCVVDGCSGKHVFSSESDLWTTIAEENKCSVERLTVVNKESRQGGFSMLHIPKTDGKGCSTNDAGAAETVRSVRP